MSVRSGFFVGTLMISGIASSGASAADSSSPYIDRLRARWAEEGKTAVDSTEGSYTERLRAKLGPNGVTGEGYTEALKEKLKVAPSPTPHEGEGYATEERRRLEVAAPAKSAIQAVAEGRSELEAKRRGEIHWGASFKIGASIARTITATDAALVSQDFANIYGSGWSPDLQLSGEWQPFHSEWFGNVGLVAGTGFSSFRGKGVFALSLTNPVTSAPFGSESKTVFRYLTIPLWAGANYRFNLFRIVRPYVQGGAGVIGSFETREDNDAKKNALSRAVFMSAGAALWLNPLLPKTAWDLYAGSGIHHYSLIVDYTRVLPLGSGIRVASQGISLGLLYEF